jgi:hypothetical protein
MSTGLSRIHARLSSVNLRSLLAVAILLSALTPANSAWALLIRLTHLESGAQVTIADGGAGDSNPVAGALTFIGSVGVFTINVSTGLSKPVFPASPTLGQMNLNSVNSSTSAGTLLLELTDINFPATHAGDLMGTVGGITQGAAEFWAYKHPANLAFSTGGAFSLHLGPFTGSFGDSTSAPHGPLIDPYSMTLVAQLIHGPGVTTTNFDFDVTNTATPVSLPGSLPLIATALLVLAIASRRGRIQGRNAI